MVENPFLEGSIYMATKKRPICYVHDDISSSIDELEEILKKKDLLKRPIITKIKEMRETLAFARKLGERMESRMQEYRDAIEDLGFVRKKKKKKK